MNETSVFSLLLNAHKSKNYKILNYKIRSPFTSLLAAQFPTVCSCNTVEF